MRILHLSLGLPRYRSGGLPRYAYDLAMAESYNGHLVFMLYPGNVDFLNTKTRIRVKEKGKGVSIYKIINPRYVPIPFGIENTEWLMKPVEPKVYEDFLSQVRPDLVHIHTFMGFHKELFETIKKMGIKTIYTSHDYFALCPQASFVNSDHEVCNGSADEKCSICNAGAKNSMLYQFVLQSEWYPSIKNSSVMQAVKKLRRRKGHSSDKVSYEGKSVGDYEISKFSAYLKYHMSFLEYVDFFHFNSSVAKDIYLPFIGNKKYFVENITVDGLKDNRDIYIQHRVIEEKIKIGYIGIADFHKGYWLLRDSGKILYEKGYSFEMHFYGDEFNIDVEKYPFCVEKGHFIHSNIENVLRELDVLVVPGYWYETFGFTAIEALANNVLVLVSDRTGAKDIFRGRQDKHVFSPTAEKLAEMIELYISEPELLHEEIQSQKCIDYEFSMNRHAEKMIARIANTETSYEKSRLN